MAGHAAVKICHNGMLEDTNSLDGAQILKGNDIPQDISHFQRILTFSYCKLHPGRKIEYKCINHSMYICSSCVIVGHRNCNDLECTDTLEYNKEDFQRQYSERMSKLQEKIRQCIRDEAVKLIKRLEACEQSQLKIENDETLIETVLKYGDKTQILMLENEVQRTEEDVNTILQCYENAATKLVTDAEHSVLKNLKDRFNKRAEKHCDSPFSLKSHLALFSLRTESDNLDATCELSPLPENEVVSPRIVIDYPDF